MFWSFFSTPDLAAEMIQKLKRPASLQVYISHDLADASFPKRVGIRAAEGLLTLNAFPFANHFENAGIKLHHRVLKAYFPKANVNKWTIYGHAAAESMVALFFEVGRNLDRQSFLEKAYSFRWKQSLVAPPIHATNTLNWINAMRVAQVKNGSFVFISPWIQAL